MRLGTGRKNQQTLAVRINIFWKNLAKIFVAERTEQLATLQEYIEEEVEAIDDVISPPLFVHGDVNSRRRRRPPKQRREKPQCRRPRPPHFPCCVLALTNSCRQNVLSAVDEPHTVRRLYEV